MLILHTWGTTNGRKPIMALEELQLAYELRPVDITQKAQRSPAFLKMNPLGKIPVLEDPDVGLLTESNAILFHLATKTGRLLGVGTTYLRVVEWLFWQASNCGPALSNCWRLKQAGAAAPAGELARWRDETERCLTMLESTLAASKYLTDAFSVADIAMLPHVRREIGDAGNADKWPSIRAWLERCEARPSVAKGLAVEIG